MGVKTALLIIVALVAAFLWVAGASVIATTLSDIADTPWVAALYVGSLAVLVGALYFIYRRRFAKPTKRKRPSVDRVKRPVDDVLSDIDRRLTDPAEMERVSPAEEKPATVALCGAPGVGTSTIVRLLQDRFDADMISEAGALSTEAEENRRVLALARRAQIPVVIIDNDLRSHEHEAVSSLAAHNPQTIIVLNKADRYAGADLERLKAVITDRLQGLIDPTRIIAITADPRPVRRVQANGAEIEIEQETDIDALADLLAEQVPSR